MDKGEICEKCVCLWREEMGKQIVGQYEVHIWKSVFHFTLRALRQCECFPFNKENGLYMEYPKKGLLSKILHSSFIAFIKSGLKTMTLKLNDPK